MPHPCAQHWQHTQMGGVSSQRQGASKIGKTQSSAWGKKYNLQSPLVVARKTCK